LFGAGCGLRVGQVLGLIVGRADSDRALLPVSVQLQAAPGQQPRLVATKSEASIRSVLLPDSVAVGLDRSSPAVRLSCPRGWTGW